MSIHKTKLDTLLRSQRGFFSVTFTKKDGSIRHMHCRIPKPKPDAKRRNPASTANSYLLVTDFQLYMAGLRSGLSKSASTDKAYRLVNLDTVTQIAVGGKRLVVCN